MQGTPPQPAPAARSEHALSVLLQQLSELLIAASEDSSNTPGSSSTQGQNIASRMRSVLLMLVAQCTEHGETADALEHMYESCSPISRELQTHRSCPWQ